jgi:ferrous iron transport protein B
VAGVYLVLFSLVILIGAVLNRVLKGYSPEFLLEIPSYRLPPLTLLGKKMFLRVKGFLIEAVPVVFLGVVVINILLYFGLFDSLTGFFAPVMQGLFGLPKEAVISLAIGFLRKDVAVGMLLPLSLSMKQFFIATTLLAVSFPCIATFVVLWKELGLKDFLKATFLMIIVTLVVGTVLNFGIR